MKAGKTVAMTGIQAGKSSVEMASFRRISMSYIDSALSKCKDDNFEKAIDEACPFVCQTPTLISMQAWEECKAYRLNELASQTKTQCSTPIK